MYMITKDLLLASISTPQKLRFSPAYSGGYLYTSGIGIPDSLEVNGETYPEGTSIPTVVDLSSIVLPEDGNIPVLYIHNPMHRLGHTTLIETDGLTLSAEAILSSVNRDVAEILESDEAGARWQASIGSGLINPANKLLIKPGETITVNNKSLTGPFILLSNLQLAEISIVPAGADPQTEVLFCTANPFNGEFTMSFEDWAVLKCIDLTTLDEANLAAIKALYDAEIAAEAVEAEGTEGEEEEKTCTETVVAEGVTEEVVVEEEDKEPEKVTASARVKRAFGSLNTPRIAGTTSYTRRDSLKASALLNCGVPADWLAKNGFSMSCIDNASRIARDTSLLSLMGEDLQASGIKPNYRNPHAIVSQYQQYLKGAASTLNFGETNILSPILDKQMRFRFEEAVSIWDKLFRKRIANSPRGIAAVDFDLLGKAALIPENGDYPSAVLKSAGSTYDIQKYGVEASISLESQLSDDLGELSRVGDQIVYALMDAQADTFWRTFWSNRSTAFSGSNAVTEVLNVTGLSKCNKAMKSKKNAAGRFANVPGKYLLVPPALEDKALNLFNWQWGDANASGNPHVGKYEVLSDPCLGADGGYTGATDTNYFLVADTARYPLGEYALQKGFEFPMVKEEYYDHKDNLNIRGLSMIGFLQYTTDVPGVYSSGTVDSSAG